MDKIAKPKDLLSVRKKIGLVGQSAALERVLRIVEQVAGTDISVLIIGESGTGKELIAEAIHDLSPRWQGPFIVVNAGAIPEGIMESELFGHEKGAFTGAVGTRKGYFEMADGGTVFLDEIGEMPVETQVRLLRILEGREFIRVGGSVPRKINVRVLAATNKDLAEAVRKGEFREDLYFRLNAVRIDMPPLRERREDIPILANYFAHRFCSQNHIEFQGFTDEALQLLSNFQWPGNIRELKNTVERVIVMEKGQIITGEILRRDLSIQEFELDRHLPVPVNRSSDELEREFLYRALLDLKGEIAQLREVILGKYVLPSRRLPAAAPFEPSPYREVAAEVTSDEEANDHFPTMEEMERELIHRALERSGGNKRKAASMLAISERTLYRKIKEYALPF